VNDWRKEAACRGLDPELFFPERGESVKPATRVCDSCVVRTDCLEYSLAAREHFGIWGGLAERQRRRIRSARTRERRALAAFAAELDIDEAPITALAWVQAVLDAGDVAEAWPMTDDILRAEAVEEWIDEHLDDPGALTVDDLAAELAQDRPAHAVWPVYAAEQADRWRDAFPPDLRANGGAWDLLARPEPVAVGVVAAVFVRTPPTRGAGPVPARRLLLAASAGGWRVAEISAGVARRRETRRPELEHA
jgi:WhiB family transcriptional regulator, redox-sensing transcriptional regulator